MELDLGQIVSQIFAFLIMMWILKRFAWKPILNVLEERQRKIATEFAEIEEEKRNLDGLQNEYRVMLKKLDAHSEARFQEEVRKAERVSAEMREETEKKIREMMQDTKEQMRLELLKAKSLLKDQMIDMVIQSTEKILRHELNNKPELKEAIEESLEEVK